MRKAPVLTVLITAAVVVLAFALNPTPEQHRAKIKASIAERSPLAGWLAGPGRSDSVCIQLPPLGRRVVHHRQ
jgi:hypothetical protein